MVVMVAIVLLCCSTLKFSAALEYEEMKIQNEEGERRCVEIDKCPSLYSLFSSRALTPLTVEFLKRSKCELDEGNRQLCCGEPTTQVSNASTDDQHSHDTFDLNSHPKASLLPLESCGLDRNRIWEESVTQLDEFPWLALLYMKKEEEELDGDYYDCGGVLISKRYVLTVANCLWPDMTPVMVRLGDHYLGSDPDCVTDVFSGRLQCAPPVQNFRIEKVILHPDFDPSEFCNDIALIRLDRDVKLDTLYVKPICLPVDDVEIGRKLLLAGWGDSSSDFLNHERHIFKVKTEMPVVSMKKCSEDFMEEWCDSHYRLCTYGTDGKGSSNGDSGMPLMHWTNFTYGKRRYNVAGLVSYGINKHEQQSTVYTNVLKYIPWIVENIEP